MFVAGHGLSLGAVSRGYSLAVLGTTLRWLLLLHGTGSARGLSSFGSWALERRLGSCGSQA